MGDRKSLTLELPVINQLGAKGRTEELMVLLAGSDARDVKRRMAIVHALGVAGDHRAVMALLERFEDPLEDDEVRWHVAQALGEAGNPVAITPLADALIAEDLRMRVAVVVGLGGIDDEQAIEPLLRALASENTTLRSYAAEALAGFSRPDVVSALVEALGDRSRRVRRRAARSLAQTGDARLAPVLRERAEQEGFLTRRILSRLADDLDGNATP